MRGAGGPRNAGILGWAASGRKPTTTATDGLLGTVPRAQRRSLPTGSPETGQRCAEAQEPRPSGVGTGSEVPGRSLRVVTSGHGRPHPFLPRSEQTGTCSACRQVTSGTRAPLEAETG